MPKKKAKINPQGTPQATPEGDKVLSPAGLKVIKTALVIMTILIVAGLGLLIYGFKTGLNNIKRVKTESTLIYPRRAQLQEIITTPQGEIRLIFADRGRRVYIITLSPDGTAITSHVILKQGETDTFSTR